MKLDLKLGDLVVLDSVVHNFIVANHPFKVIHLTNTTATCVALDQSGSPIGGDNPDFQRTRKVQKKSIITVLKEIEDFEVFSVMNRAMNAQFTAFQDAQRSLGAIRDKIKKTGELPSVDSLNV
ncbi:hypothetical protein A7M79_00310 [Acinetobacter baumannii]|uniref:hypothetical protein n=1 Tax=Acinetobacter baumannii TaxID=470 RepID=UPI0008DD6D55|nr:hypothetical protein [Acinetobacter baumannii]OIH11966.1 hypothetical protein A7M79_00310 [Acinetobacter baumannii]